MIEEKQKTVSEGEIREFRVGEEEAGARQDVFLTARLEGISRSRIRVLIEKGRALVNGKLVKPHHPLSPGDRVEVVLPPPSESLGEGLPGPEPISLDILYEDEGIIVINKPPGLLVHPLRAGQGGTLVNALLHRVGSLPETGGVLRPGIVHRLDRDTSGVMIAAKSDRALAGLTRQFRDRTVGKEYLAIVRGEPPAARGECDYPLGRSLRRRTRVTVRYSGGRPARTAYEVIERFGACSLLRLEIMTGRTHQIRVHLSRLGCPVLGDREYGRKNGEGPRAPEAPRQMLHAHRLRIAHPLTGEPMEFVAPIPGDMENVLNVLRGEKNRDKQIDRGEYF
ncbi:MAG: RluA family pseudouridine synthase [PVC group bacterium]